MKIKLVREVFSKKSTIGTLYVNGLKFGYTLEDVDRKLEDNPEGKVYGKTAIPRGLYPVVVDYSQRFGRIMPRLVNVPGFVGVRIHPGNTHADTDGCILVGDVRGKDSIRSSRIAYQRLLARIEDALDRGQEVTIEVT